MGTKRSQIKNLNVADGWLLVKPIIQNENIGGLVKPVQYEDKSDYGTVVRTSREDIKEESIVYFNRYAPIKQEFEGEEYLFLRVEDILAWTL